MPRVLLIEDDAAIASLVAAYLRGEGFEVATAGDGPAGLAAAAAHPPDAIVLDWMLPGLDGLEVCRRLRAQWNGPILMLTARTDELDQVVALEVGVDDWLAKPVRPRVLLAHLRALLRRLPAAAAPQARDRFALGRLAIDRGRREVAIDGAPLELTTAEFDLLWALARHAGEPVTREALFKELRGIDYDGLDRSMDMRVAQLRKKLRDATTGWDDPIRTVRGVGYQLVRP